LAIAVIQQAKRQKNRANGVVRTNPQHHLSGLALRKGAATLPLITANDKGMSVGWLSVVSGLLSVVKIAQLTTDN
jgi:hypothetical protein